MIEVGKLWQTSDLVRHESSQPAKLKQHNSVGSQIYNSGPLPRNSLWGVCKDRGKCFLTLCNFLGGCFSSFLCEIGPHTVEAT